MRVCPWEFSPGARQEMNKEPPCGHWHQVAFSLLGVSMATRQCLRPQEPGEGDPL